MQSEGWKSQENEARELYGRVRNNEVTLADLSIAEVILLTAYLEAEIERKTSRLKAMYQSLKES